MSRNLAEREGRMEMAVKTHQNDNMIPLCELAGIFNVTKTSLKRRIDGIPLRQNTRSVLFKLTSINEELLLNWFSVL